MKETKDRKKNVPLQSLSFVVTVTRLGNANLAVRAGIQMCPMSLQQQVQGNWPGNMLLLLLGQYSTPPPTCQLAQVRRCEHNSPREDHKTSHISSDIQTPPHSTSGIWNPSPPLQWELFIKCFCPPSLLPSELLHMFSSLWPAKEDQETFYLLQLVRVPQVTFVLLFCVAPKTWRGSQWFLVAFLEATQDKIKVCRGGHGVEDVGFVWYEQLWRQTKNTAWRVIDQKDNMRRWQAPDASCGTTVQSQNFR